MEEDSDSDSGAAQLSSSASSPPDASRASPFFPEPSHAAAMSSPSAAVATATTADAAAAANGIDIDRCDEVEMASSPLVMAYGQLHLGPPGDSDAGPSCLDKSGVKQEPTLVPGVVGNHHHPSNADSVWAPPHPPPPSTSPKTAGADFDDADVEVDGVDPLGDIHDPLFLLQDAASSQGMSNKGKQKQRAVSFHLPPDQDAEPGAARAGPSREGAAAEPATPPPADFHPLQPGDPGWEISAGRPPVKLPIRFHDALGRNFVFPWEKAKTWEVRDRIFLMRNLF
jgi:hypothetical protein